MCHTKPKSASVKNGGVPSTARSSHSGGRASGTRHDRKSGEKKSKSNSDEKLPQVICDTPPFIIPKGGLHDALYAGVPALSSSNYAPQNEDCDRLSRLVQPRPPRPPRDDDSSEAGAHRGRPRGLNRCDKPWTRAPWTRASSGPILYDGNLVMRVSAPDQVCGGIFAITSTQHIERKGK